MQFVLLIFFNIIMFAIFYLVISLKLEKKATEFREKRFRKEMDDIIKDFNATAERNISLLESRLALMKKILEKSGEMKSVDIKLDDRIRPADMHGTGDRFETDAREGVNNGFTKDAGKISDFFAESKRLMSNISKKVADRFELYRQKRSDAGKADNEPELNDGRIDIPKRAPVGFDFETIQSSKLKAGSVQEFAIEKNFTRFQDLLPALKQEKASAEIDEVELSAMFNNNQDKYSLVSELYTKGYSVDIISRCSGIPQGEIRLVLNLNIS
jgi:hypothetical protein